MLLDLMSPWALSLTFAITMAAGFVKGAVGFAMPLIMISSLSIYLDPKLVVAGIVLPILASNLIQAARSGWGEALSASREFRRYILIICVAIFVAAQFIVAIPSRVMFLVLGVPVVVLSLIQLSGVRFSIPAEQRRLFDWLIGILSGFLGGLAGTWGPPTVLYLLALDTPKGRQLAVQGVVYSLGSVMLLAGHLQSGVLDRQTMPFSAFLLIPSLTGMWLGLRLGERLDQGLFRRATLVVLVFTGLNLLRRGLLG